MSERGPRNGAYRVSATKDETAPADGAETEPSESAGRPRRGRAAGFLGFLGELLITTGLVLALFVVYSLWWTNVVADREAGRQGDRVRDHWARQPKQGSRAFDAKSGIGFLHVPAMKNGEVLVKKGTATDILNDGVAGYYTDPVKSALPQDEKGNFTLAAHRDGHGAKFHNIDKLDKGDPIVFESKDRWYVYRVFAILPQTSKYDVEVLDQVPEKAGVKKPGRYITLTTCTPVYTSNYRYIVWGKLERVDPVDAKRTLPKELR